MGNIGDNGGPPLAQPFSKTRWLKAIDHCSDPEKPMGALAMAAVLFNEMNNKGEGAAVSDAEVARRCNCSDRSVRDYKKWLRNSEFVAIAVKGVRGSVTEFKARMPDEIPETISGNQETDYRQSLPAIDEPLPEMVAAIPEIPENFAGIAFSPRARGLDNNITKTNTSLDREEGEDRGYGGKGNPGTEIDEATPFSALEAFQLYNEMASRVGLPQARTLTPQRRKSMMARMREHGGIEAWKIALANIERSKFLQGSNDRGWRADLDFLIQASRFTKVVEGTYGNGAHADTEAVEETKEERIARIVAEADEMFKRREGRL